MNKIIAFIIVLWLFISTGITSAAYFDYFTTKDGQLFCSKQSEDAFKSCIEFKGEIKWKEDLHKVSMDKFYVVNEKVWYCIKDGKEVEDVSICDGITYHTKGDTSYQCTIKNGERTCTDAIQNNDTIVNTAATWSENTDNIAFNENPIEETNSLIKTLWDNGTCKINGEIVPCDQMMEQAWSLFKVFGFIWIIGVIIAIVVWVFWLMMLIDAIKNQKENKVLWILVILFTSTIGAIIYYIAAKRPRNKLITSNQTTAENSTDSIPQQPQDSSNTL